MTAHIQPLLAQSVAHTFLACPETFQVNGTCVPPQGWPGVSLCPDGEPYNGIKVYVLYVAAFKHEIEAALFGFKGYELDGDEVNRERFPLPTLGPLLEDLAKELHSGHGVCVIRGLDPDMFSKEDNIIIYLGISDYIGDQRGVQSSKGAMLCKACNMMNQIGSVSFTSNALRIAHVVEKKSWTVPPERRHGIHTNVHLPFHTDMGTDILALQVRQCAAVGGQTCVSPVRAIYNDLMRSHPLVLHELSKPNWPIRSSTRGYILAPLITYHRGNLMFSMDPARIGPREGNRAPQITREQEAALMILQSVARKHQVKLDHQPGDLVYLNNWSVLHSREAYEDGEKTSRHLIRLWLHNSSLGWHVPDSMHLIWDCTFGRRSQKIVNHSYPLVPMPAYIESKYSSGTAAFVPDDDDDEDEEGKGQSSNVIVGAVAKTQQDESSVVQEDVQSQISGQQR